LLVVGAHAARAFVATLVLTLGSHMAAGTSAYAATSLNPLGRPLIPGGGATLFAVSAVSASDAWAVGIGGQPELGSHTVTMHWDGADWTRVSSPSPGRYAGLNAVSAVGANDVWAAGWIERFHEGATVIRPMMLHWDGRTWSRIVLPVDDPRLEGVVLTGVSADAPDDAWAVGYAFDSPAVPRPAAAVHWDGKTWRSVPVPLAGSYDSLRGVWANSVSDAWAVGSTDVNGGHYVVTVTLHWNGESWKRIHSPNPARGNDVLTAVSGDASGGAWAVGDAGNHRGRTLAMRWVDGHWKAFPTPRVGKFPELDGVSADEPDDAWAVGGSGPSLQPLILHWDGSSWSKAHAPSEGIGSIAYGVAAITTDDALAVGEWDVEFFRSKPLLLVWNGTSWRRI
jgi:hypothetical protein